MEDLLRLSSLRNARMEAGKGGLSRIVASLSVLEYADPGQMADAFFRNDEYYGSEIVITGFMNNPKDEKRQFAVAKRLAEAGEVGLILYYVGLFMPRIPEEMKRIANENNFVLIVMPENRMDFRYLDAISEIMEAIVKDRLNNTAFVGELLDQVARLPDMGSERPVYSPDTEYVMNRFPILLHKNRHMELFIFKQGEIGSHGRGKRTGTGTT